MGVGEIHLEQRFVEEQYDPTEMVVYDPRHPQWSFVFGHFYPSLEIGPFGEWRLAAAEQEPKTDT